MEGLSMPAWDSVGGMQKEFSYIWYVILSVIVV